MCHFSLSVELYSIPMYDNDEVDVHVSIYTVSQKKNVILFIFCDIFVRFHPILLIFGRNIPQEIWNKHM